MNKAFAVFVPLVIQLGENSTPPQVGRLATRATLEDTAAVLVQPGAPTVLRDITVLLQPAAASEYALREDIWIGIRVGLAKLADTVHRMAPTLGLRAHYALPAGMRAQQDRHYVIRVANTRTNHRLVHQLVPTVVRAMQLLARGLHLASRCALLDSTCSKALTAVRTVQLDFIRHPIIPPAHFAPRVHQAPTQR